MSLDSKVHAIYGYKINGNKLVKDIEKYSSEKTYKLPNNQDVDKFIENLSNDNELLLIEDYMRGNYNYIGIPIITQYESYGEEFEYSYDIKSFLDLCNDDLLDEKIQEKLPFMVNNEYDVAGLLYGQLPKLYIFRQIW